MRFIYTARQKPSIPENARVWEAGPSFLKGAVPSLYLENRRGCNRQPLDGRSTEKDFQA
jgi:hypothetical protein